MNYTLNFTQQGFDVDFGSGYGVSVNINTKIAYKLKDGTVKDQFSIDGMTLSEFHEILINIEKSL